MKEHRRRQVEQRLASGEEWQDQAQVLCSATGGPVDPSYQAFSVQEGARAGLLPAIRFHDLRHTAATLLLSRGVHPKVVSEMLGHGGVLLTLDTYSPHAALHAQAAAVMDDLLSA